MARKLIINADGFGFTYGNNKGIFESLAAGAIKSVSVNVGFPAFEETPRLAREYPDISIGIHLDLTVGPCVCDPTDVPDLVDGKGEFLGKQFHKKAARGQIPHEQMVRELSAQVEKMQAAGVSISHWDSHQNQHLYPPFFRAAIEVAKKYGINRMRTHKHYVFAPGKCRWLKAALHMPLHPHRAAVYLYSRRVMQRAHRLGMKTADRLITPGIISPLRKFHRRFWLDLFDWLPEGISEVYCHPGYPDETLAANATYVNERLEELKILSDPALADEARKRGVELVSFREL